MAYNPKMHVCTLAMHKIREIKREEKEKQNFLECFQHNICPECGGKLKGGGEPCWWEGGKYGSKYQCQHCKEKFFITLEEQEYKPSSICSGG